MIRHWNFIEGVLAPPECERIVGVGADLLAAAPDAERSDQGYAYRSVWIDREHPDFTRAFDALDRAVHESNRAYFALEIWPTHALQFTLYDSEKGHFHAYHRDALLVSPEPSDRKISFVLQLSAPDSYEGGDIQMRGVRDYPDPEMARRQGGAMLHASILQTAVAPVTKGARYALLGWRPGPHWR